FIFENVPGITSAENGKLWADIKSYFLKSGYSLDFRLLNAYDFGVLQNRKRIIIIGWKSEYDLRFPEFEKDKNVEKYRIKDLFSDLPFLRSGDKLYIGKYTSNPSGYISEYGIRKDDDILTLHLTRSVNERDGRIYRFYIESWLKERRRPEYDELPDELKTHKNRKIFRDRFKVIAPDLPYSQTITAHLEKDGHYYIHYDINQLRSISVREAARIQSFPDNYYFEGPMTSMFRQIGNAVPPIMAEKIAVELRKMMVMI
ncbi:MAG: DNA cytosine methyltransferase, partial [Thermoplasmata archaeon]